MKNNTIQNQDGLTIISDEDDVNSYLGKDKTPEKQSASSEKSAKPISKAEERRRKKAEKKARDKEIEAKINGFLYGDDGVTKYDEPAPNPLQSLQSKRNIVTIMTDKENFPEIQDSPKTILADNTNGDNEDIIDPIIDKSSVIPCSSEAREEEQEKSDSLSSPDIPISEESSTIVDITTTSTTPTTPTEVAIVEESGTPSPTAVPKKDVSPPKTTRISAKMRKRSREEFCEFYLKKCDTKHGKPITIEPELMERLYKLCLLTGDRYACPTYLINNLLKEIIPTFEEHADGWK